MKPTQSAPTLRRHRRLLEWCPHRVSVTEPSPVIAAKGFKRLGIGVAAFVAAGIGAFALVPLFIPADHVRDAVKAEIKAVTGLDPVLRGDAVVSLFPSAGVTLGDV